MKKLVLILTVLAVALSASAVWCQGRPGGMGGPGGPGGQMMASPAMAVTPPKAAMIERMSETLQLTDEQLTKLKEIISQSDTNMMALNKALSEANTNLRAALYASEYDASKVTELAAKAEKAEANVVTASIAVWTQIRGVLTADQVASLQKTASSQNQRPSGPPPGGDNQAPPPAE